MSAAASVRSKSSGVCTVDTKAASNADGAKYTPCSSIEWKNRAYAAASERVTASQPSTGPGLKNMLNSDPTRLMDTGTSCASAAVRNPVVRASAVSSSRSYTPGSSSDFSVAMPAATATGFPDSVPAWYAGPSGATCSMTSRRPPYAPMGMPPPMILPSVVRSGVTPYSPCAPPCATRKPVITSSKISSAPCSLVMSRSPCRKPSPGGTTPMLPATGSTITAAMSPSCAANCSRTLSMSLKSASSVSPA